MNMDSTTEDDHNLSSVSASDAEFITDLEGGKVTLTFTDNDLENFKACSSVLDWVHPDLPICSVENTSRGDGQEFQDNDGNPGFLQIPSLAIVIFLREDETDKFTQADNNFQQHPWIFHHSESVNRATTKCVPSNSLDYYRAGETGPLCGIRQIPNGKQIVRIVRFINHPDWQDNVDLYSLILSQQPEVTKQDFCLFTTGQTDYYDVQFAIKRAPKGITCTPVKNVTLNFRINHPGHIVPLLPFVCNNTSERHWQSTDFDRNVIQFEAQDHQSDSPDPFYYLLEPVDSDSALSDATIDAYAPSTDCIDSKDNLRPGHLFVDQRQADGRESQEQFQEDLYSHGHLTSPECPKLENLWSPVSQTDSGQFSHPTDQSTLLSSPDDHLHSRDKRCGSYCSSDLGFQDRYSSASESKWDDHSSNRSKSQPFDRQTDHQVDDSVLDDSVLDDSVFGYSQNTYSDYGVSDGYASTCLEDESEISYPNYVKPRCRDQNANRNATQRKSSTEHKWGNFHSKSTKELHTAHTKELHTAHTNGFGSQILYEKHHENCRRKGSSSCESRSETPQQVAFRKLRKYKEVRSRSAREDTLDLFNISSHQSSNDNSASKSYRKHNHNQHNQKTRLKSFPDDLKSVSECESTPGSETEYEHAYESIERDLEIINNVLYGQSSQTSRKPTNSNAKHRTRTKATKVMDSLSDLPNDIPNDLPRHLNDPPYIHGFYV